MADEGRKLKQGSRGANIGLGIDFNFGAFDGLINNRGSDVLHEIGMRCTCNMEDSHAGAMEQTHVPRRRKTIGCDICGRDGYIFRDPHKIVGMVTGVREDKTRLESGWALPGDCTFSPLPGYRITAGDMITFLWEEPIPDGQVIMRGAGTMSDNTSRKTNLETNEDRLWYNAISSIWCEDEDGNVYKEGDFELDGSKIIKWNSSQPMRGKVYVIKYNAYLEWIAFVPANIRRDRNRDIGDRIVLRKSHVALLNESDPSAKVTDRITFCARISGC